MFDIENRVANTEDETYVGWHNVLDRLIYQD